MFVYYYKYEGRMYLVCCKGLPPGKLSPIWNMPSACMMLVPGTEPDEHEDDAVAKPIVPDWQDLHEQISAENVQ